MARAIFGVRLSLNDRRKQERNFTRQTRMSVREVMYQTFHNHKGSISAYMTFARAIRMRQR